MPVKIKEIAMAVPCMDCEKYSGDCDHLNTFVSDLRKFMHDYSYDKEIELQITIDCMDKHLCI